MEESWWRASGLARIMGGMSGRSLGAWEEHDGASGRVLEPWRNLEELRARTCLYLTTWRDPWREGRGPGERALADGVGFEIDLNNVALGEALGDSFVFFFLPWGL